MSKLISKPADVGIDPEEIRANPGVIVDIHEDVLRDLMTTSHPIERPRRIALGAEGNKPRRRTCV